MTPLKVLVHGRFGLFRSCYPAPLDQFQGLRKRIAQLRSPRSSPSVLTRTFHRTLLTGFCPGSKPFSSPRSATAARCLLLYSRLGRQESQGVARVGGTPEFMAPEVWSGVYGAWGCSARLGRQDRLDWAWWQEVLGRCEHVVNALLHPAHKRNACSDGAVAKMLKGDCLGWGTPTASAARTTLAEVLYKNRPSTLIWPFCKLNICTR